MEPLRESIQLSGGLDPGSGDPDQWTGRFGGVRYLQAEGGPRQRDGRFRQPACRAAQLARRRDRSSWGESFRCEEDAT